MGLHECVWHGQLTHLERYHQCWKVYPSSRTTYAPIQTSSLSGKTLHFPTWHARPHTASRIRVLKWPACSPDLSPIENIWRIIKRKMRQRRPKTVEQLEACIRQEWDNIPIPKLEQLVYSVPRRLQTVIKRRGDAHSGKHGLVPTFLRCVDAMKFKINLFFP